MGKLITAIVTTIIVSVLWVLMIRYRPTWIENIKSSKANFPENPKNGDVFIIDGIEYIFITNKWVVKPVESDVEFAGRIMNNQNEQVFYDINGIQLNPQPNARPKTCERECLVKVGENKYTCTGCSSEFRPSFRLTQQQQDLFDKLTVSQTSRTSNNGSRKFPASCYLWADMIKNNSSSSAIEAQWKICSAQLG